MLSNVQSRAAIVSKVVSSLSFRYQQQDLASVSTLLKDPFFLDCVQHRPLHLTKLLGMSTYSCEDALYQVYGLEWDKVEQSVRLYRGRQPILVDTPDDVLGTVYCTMADRARTHYPACEGLRSSIDTGFAWTFSVPDVYTVFDRAGFEATVGQYLDQHHPTEYHHYLAAMAQLEGVPPPMECPAIDKPLCGKAYDALAKLLLLFRKMNRLPPIVAKENLELRERCSLMDLN